MNIPSLLRWGGLPLTTAWLLLSAPAPAATYTVTTAADTGSGSLREAITFANANPGHDFIHFDIAPSNMVHVISLTAPLPPITESVTIDGLTQPGSLPNALPEGFSATNLITLSGALLAGVTNPPVPAVPGNDSWLTNAPHGLVVRANDVTVRGLRIIRFLGGSSLTNWPSAIALFRATNTVIEGCVMGVSADTSIEAANWAGITADHCATVRIGGTNVAQRNLLASQPAWQMRFFNSVSNVVEGNFVGLAARFPAAHIAPGPGVVFEGGYHNRVGGHSPGARNSFAFVGAWILDPDLDGAVLLRDSHTNAVLGNWFGLRPPGTVCVTGGGESPCGLGVLGVSRGVVIENGFENRVGGPSVPSGNVICGGVGGVDIAGTNAAMNFVQGNRIGTHPDGLANSTFALGPTSSGNGDGVVLRQGAAFNQVGGAADGEGNLIANNSGHGVALFDARTNQVFGNFIGTDLTGTNALPNGTFGGGGDGVYLSDGASENDIGGPSPGEGNLISGNHNHGVHLAGFDVEANRVRGNLIGPAINGVTRLPYQPPLFLDRGNYASGVRIDAEASRNQIGGYTEAEGNLISGNGEYGVHIVGLSEIGPASDNRILGNRIGTDRTGLLPLANALGGVRIESVGNIVGEPPILIFQRPPGGAPLPLPWPSAANFGAPGNLISGNGGPGVILDDSNNLVSANRIGTDREGTNALPNMAAGVLVRHSYNTIGGTQAGEGNLISGNAGPGVKLATGWANDNLVEGNLIGTDWTGTNALPNTGDGVLVTDDAYANTIGSFRGNTISGNLGHGVTLLATPSFSGITADNLVRSNRIGTDLTGELPVPNASNGVHVVGAPGTALVGNLLSGNAGAGAHLQTVTNGLLQANVIGANASGATALPNAGPGVRLHNASGVLVGDALAETNGNRIAFNTGHGVLMTGSSAGNRILGNSVSENGALGINLDTLADPPSGVTSNDPLDFDAGPNGLQNFPELTVAVVSGTNTVISGELHSTPLRAFTIELFRNALADPSGHGEGDVLVARTNLATDAAGNAAFSLAVPGEWAGWGFAATATDLTTGDTSEFGPATVALPPLEFVFTHRDGGDFEAGFPAASGIGYSVLTNADLTTTNWAVYTNLTGTGGTNTIRFPVTGAPKLFFRLRVP
ncbi:MAG: right-handed parallel beta-helix repeat-containing protein [Limisphaerales bacterium]